jgi:monoamine oxidase
MSANKIEIGIAGAGLAGLFAGILLQQAGHRVRIFESRPVPGGRIQSLIKEGYLIEAGPEFIHGSGMETIRLLHKYAIPFVPANGKMYQVRSGHFVISDEMTTDDWDTLLDKMYSLDRDMPFGEFLKKYFPESKYNELRNSAMRFAEGFDLADVNIASTTALAREWIQEDSAQFRIPSGYQTLIRAMADEFESLGGEILLEHAVESVNWHSKEIKVNIHGNRQYVLEKLVLSLPISMLSQTFPEAGQPVFSPSLHERQKCFAQIGFGAVIKIVMIWESAFWKDRIPDAHFIFSDTFISTWWTQFPLDLPLLTGWIGGPAAGEISDKSDDFFLGKALESLSVIFTISVNDLKNKLKIFHVFNWKKDIWTRGAYSYALVNSTKSKSMGCQPLKNMIYFSGEAFYEGPFPGTVEAALVSGRTAATQLLADIK